jgi:NNP family nitrate/nitrite transporter-like MFS transporter
VNDKYEYGIQDVSREPKLNDQASRNRDLRFRLAPLLILTGIFYLSFLARVIFSPMMPVIERDLGVSHGGAGSLFLLVSLGYAISTLSSSLVSSRISHHRIILISTLSTGIAITGIALSSKLVGIQLGMIAVGLATGLYLPSAIATITDLTHSALWGRAIGIHEVATTLAFFTAPLIAEFFLVQLTWRQGLVIVGAASILGGLVYSLSNGGNFVGEAPTSLVLGQLLRRPILWIMIFTFILGIGGNFGIYSIMPLYLVSERGITRETANTIVSLSRPIGVFAVFLAGWVSDRVGHWFFLSILLIGSGFLIILIGLIEGIWLFPIILLQPILAVAFFPPAFSALSGISSKQLRSLVTSLTMSTAILVGTGVIPASIGLLGDKGNFSLGILLLGMIILTGGCLLLLNRSALSRQVISTD